MNNILTKNFTEEEFKCNCCGKVKIEMDFVEKLQKAREIAKIPFMITSGYRCLDHQKKLITQGIAKTSSSISSHCLGKAADIKVKNSRERYLIAVALIAVGFKRIGIAKNFIHVDNDMNKDSDVIWVY